MLDGTFVGTGIGFCSKIIRLLISGSVRMAFVPLRHSRKGQVRQGIYVHGCGEMVTEIKGLSRPDEASAQEFGLSASQLHAQRVMRSESDGKPEYCSAEIDRLLQTCLPRSSSIPAGGILNAGFSPMPSMCEQRKKFRMPIDFAGEFIEF
jgi:hypothetical protein